MVDGLSADGLMPCQRLRSTFSVFSNACIWSELHRNTSTVHTWSITVPGYKMALTLWIDKVSTELGRRGQGQCWSSCYSRVELTGKWEAKQMPLRDGAKVAGEACQSRKLPRDVRPEEEVRVGDNCCWEIMSSSQD